MGKWIGRIVVGLSLLVCAATAALWVRSYTVVDWVERDSADPLGTGYAERVICGVVLLERRNTLEVGAGPWDDNPPERKVRWSITRLETPAKAWVHDEGFWASLGFSRWDQELRGGNGAHAIVQYVTFPIWLVTVLAALPVVGLIGRAVWRWRRRRRRAAAGQCVACGYDLRGHKVGEKCPECGEVGGAGAAALRG